MSGVPPEPPDEPEPFPPFEVARSERLYDSPWVGLRRDHLVLEDGRLQEHHVVEIGDAALVVPVLGDGRILMLAQHRHTHGRTHWELPAGRLAPGESPEAAARRELREETGHRVGRLLPLPGFYPTNGISAHWAHAFLALDCEPDGPQRLDPAERLSVHALERSRVEALLDAGRIRDGFAALGLLYYLRLHAGR